MRSHIISLTLIAIFFSFGRCATAQNQQSKGQSPKIVAKKFFSAFKSVDSNVMKSLISSRTSEYDWNELIRNGNLFARIMNSSKVSVDINIEDSIVNDHKAIEIIWIKSNIKPNPTVLFYPLLLKENGKWNIYNFYESPSKIPKGNGHFFSSDSLSKLFNDPRYILVEQTDSDYQSIYISTRTLFTQSGKLIFQAQYGRGGNLDRLWEILRDSLSRKKLIRCYSEIGEEDGGYKFFFDRVGRLVAEDAFNAIDSVDWHYTYLYDSHDSLIEERTFDHSGHSLGMSRYIRDSSGRIREKQILTDTSSEVKEKIIYSGDTIRTISYNENKIDVITDDIISGSGQISMSTSIFPNGSVWKKMAYNYLPGGYLHSKIYLDHLPAQATLNYHRGFVKDAYILDGSGLPSTVK